jgi:hypothetical protein
MTAAVLDIADAVVAELVTGSFSQPFLPTRAYAPVRDLSEMKDLQVTVVPRSVEEDLAGRSSLQSRYQIDIAIQQKIDTASNTQADALMALVEEIKAHFRLRRLAGLGAIWLRTVNDPIYSPAHWRELGQFTSVITLTFSVIG